MDFPTPTSEYIRTHLSKLTSDQQPEWGSMSAQRMVEHLEDTTENAIGTVEMSLELKEEYVPKAVAFLSTEKPMPRDYKVSFAQKETPLRYSSLEKAIDSLISRWEVYETTYDSTPGMTRLHPIYGDCDRALWDRIHAKHFVHHFQQFGL